VGKVYIYYSCAAALASIR